MFKAGNIPSNKGKSGITSITRKKLSESQKRLWGDKEHRKRMSQAHTGTKMPPFSEEHRRRLSLTSRGRTPPNAGKPMAEKQKEKISLALKGRRLSKDHKDKLSERARNISATTRGKISKASKNRSQETLNKISVALKGRHNSPGTEFRKGIITGEHHPHWKGGVSFEPYCPKFNNNLKERIRERDNRVCQMCGSREDGTKLAVHHIHYDKPDCDPDLISLCRRCHTRTNYNRDYYESLFITILRSRGLLV